MKNIKEIKELQELFINSKKADWESNRELVLEDINERIVRTAETSVNTGIEACFGFDYRTGLYGYYLENANYTAGVVKDMIFEIRKKIEANGFKIYGLETESHQEGFLISWK